MPLSLVPFSGTDYLGFAKSGPTPLCVNYLSEVAGWVSPKVNALVGMRHAARTVGFLGIKHISGELACHPQ